MSDLSSMQKREAGSYLSHGLQELLKSITQSKSTDAKSNADNKRNSSVGQSKLPSQVSEQNSGASDLISLLQSSNRRNPSSTLQGQMHNSIQTVQSHQVQQPAFAWNHPTTMQQVVYVRPLGQGLNTNIAKQEPSQFLSIPFSPSSHSSVSFLNSSVIRGLSPQKNSRCLNYPSYLQMYQSKMDNHPMQQSVPNMSGNGPSNATPAKSNATASISSVKRNLEDVMNGDQRTSLGIGSKRVRMGWSPTKHTSSKWSCEKGHISPPLLVISSDEEDEAETRKIPPSNFGARIGILQQKKIAQVSETAMNIAKKFPLTTAHDNFQMESINHVGKSTNPSDAGKVLGNLNYGLSILDEPDRILDTLEEVLRDRPKRLRVNLKSLYTHVKLGCLSKVLSILLENISPAAAVHSEDGKSALHAAASKGHLDILVILVYKAGGNIDVMDKFKRTPLFIAVEKGQLKAAQFLHRAGASLSFKNFDGMGLMHVAAHKGHVQVLNWLLSHSKNLNEQDNGGWTSLMWAAEDGNCEALKLLIQKRARADLRDKELNTVLHWASMAGALEGCELLLNSKCDLNSVNMYGDTPLHIAAREGNIDVVKLFLFRGADTSIRNKEGKLPMDVCVNNPRIRDTIRLKHAIGHVTLRRQYDCDISKGKERIPVSCINEVDDEPLPLNFTYITEPIESSTVNIMKDLLTVKGCKCQHDCASDNCECVQNNEDNKCWYNDGILDAQFLDLDQPVLFECSRLCRCWSYCSNRVVQKGISFRLEVFRTVKMGWGLRTISPIPKGAFVLSYVGEVISDDAADRRADDSYLFDLDMKNSTDEDNCLDANHYGNCGRFINHSCDANLMPVRVFTHHRDWRFPGIAFFATRHIDAYEALSFDYGDKFWEIKKKNGLRCLCNSDQCKYSN